MKILLDQNWTVAGSWPFTVLQGASVETGARFAGVTPRIPAKVPGSVYDDLLRAGLIEDPYYECNSVKCEWVANRFWSYQTTFQKPETAGKCVRLVLKGIDYHAHVYFNDQKIAEHVGMYVPCVADVTDLLREGENCLTVVLENAPDEMGQIGYTSRTFTQKSRFGYKWDFATRLVNLGLYDIVYLDIADDPIEDLFVRTTKDGEVKITAKNQHLSASLSFEGKELTKGESDQGELILKIEEPKLWYPNGYGEQMLYDLVIRTTDDEKAMKVGFRTLKYQKPVCDTEDVLPYVPVFNGKKIFIKGVNMTPLDHMYGCVTRERYKKLLLLAKKANVNLIRVWGGGIIEKEDFYDLCDELGIMVWQEFIQSSSGIDNIPSKRPEFLELAAKTARAAVTEKRNHTSLTYWSGGNELMSENDKPSTFEDENLAMLKAIADELDPDILMLPTSASGLHEWFDPDHPEENQDIHGPWTYGGVEEHYALYNRSTIMLHSEFGVDGVSNLSALLTVLAPQNRKPASVRDNFTWRHHGEWWDTYGVREKPLFGEIDDLETLVKLSQYLQAEGIRYAIEAHRRRSDSAAPARLAEGELFAFKKQASIGSIVWQINEPWPCTACTCMVDYYMNPKLALSLFRDAEDPLHVSMRYDKLVWKKGESFEGYVFTHDDKEEGFDRVSVCVYGDSGEIKPTLEGNKVSFKTPEEGEGFTVVCSLFKGNEEKKSVYTFLYTDEEGKAYRTPLLKAYDAYEKRDLT